MRVNEKKEKAETEENCESKNGRGKRVASHEDEKKDWKAVEEMKIEEWGKNWSIFLQINGLIAKPIG